MCPVQEKKEINGVTLLKTGLLFSYLNIFIFLYFRYDYADVKENMPWREKVDFIRIINYYR